MSDTDLWQETDQGLYKQFVFKDFKQAFAFMQRVAGLAEAHEHHPRWHNTWNKVDIWLMTHDAGDKITDKDRALAKAIEGVVTEATKTGVEEYYRRIKLFADGGSRGNPGPSASGYVLLTMDDTVVKKSGVYLGITTNNQAEYQALKFGLEEVQKLGASEVEVYMDSMLVINQMKGIFKIKNRDLWPIHEAIKQLVGQFRQISFTHVPRELNKLADAEVNQTLDAEGTKIQPEVL